MQTVKNSDKHLAVVRAIATKSKGLTRKEIIASTKLPESGVTTKILDELEKSGFIRKYLPTENIRNTCTKG